MLHLPPIKQALLLTEIYILFSLQMPPHAQVVENGAFFIKRSVDLWNLLISLKATIPGLYL
jgi:hypothetical protein